MFYHAEYSCPMDVFEDPSAVPDRLLFYLQRRTWAEYRVLAGLPTSWSKARLIKTFGDLFTAEKACEARDTLRSTQEPVSRLSALRRLKVTLWGYLDGRTAVQSSDLISAQRHAGTVVDGRAMNYYSLDGIIKNTADPARRTRISRERDRLTTELAPLSRELWEARYHALQELGYPNYQAAYDEWNCYDLRRTADLAALILSETASAWESARDLLAEHAGVHPRDLTRADLAAAIRGSSWDHWFGQSAPGEFLMSVAKSVVGADALKHATLDTEERPQKAPRAFCAAVRIPSEIYVVTKPCGGHRDVEELLHEGAHAMHFGNANPTLPWELRYVYDEVVAEAHAFLIAGLLRSPEALHYLLRITENVATSYADYARAVELSMVRRYCGKVLFESNLHRSGDLSRASSQYEWHLENALGIPHDGAHALSDTEPGFESADYLNAWLLEAIMCDHLTTHYGTDWFSRDGTAAWLRKRYGMAGRETMNSLLSACEIAGTNFQINTLLTSLTPNDL